MTKYVPRPSPHVHEPNPTPPTSDPAFELLTPAGETLRILLGHLAAMPRQSVQNCYIISTGHGTSGPFTFTGVTLRDLLRSVLGPEAKWTAVELLGADGFGTAVERAETEDGSQRPALLATHLDGRPLTRDQGLVRLIVPSETTDALRQVKWLSRIVVYS